MQKYINKNTAVHIELFFFLSVLLFNDEIRSVSQ